MRQMASTRQRCQAEMRPDCLLWLPWLALQRNDHDHTILWCKFLGSWQPQGCTKGMPYLLHPLASSTVQKNWIVMKPYNNVIINVVI